MQLTYLMRLVSYYTSLKQQTNQRVSDVFMGYTEWNADTVWNVSKYGVFSGPYSVGMQENTDRKNSIFGHFSRSGNKMG